MFSGIRTVFLVAAALLCGTARAAEQPNVLLDQLDALGIADNTIAQGKVSNEFMSHLDWMPTIVAAAGDPDLKEKMLKGMRAGQKNARLHLDGYNFLPYLTGAVEESARREFHYFDDGAMPVGVRVEDWMIDKAAQGYRGTATTAAFLQTLAEYPPSQRPDSGSIDKLTEQFMSDLE